MFRFKALNSPLPFFVAGQIAILRTRHKKDFDVFPGVFSIASAAWEWPYIDFLLGNSSNPKSMQVLRTMSCVCDQTGHDLRPLC